jgi:hypothetical protein
VLALLWVISLVAVPIIAERKRLASWPWLVLTVVFGPFALLAVLMVPEPRRCRFPGAQSNTFDLARPRMAKR